ncbi:uncharacterized protein LOC118751079 [Rhagoletis pomonella]|uniref:uncharacterized protein LOC118751079 n=1 Tax=Rhagoletis pomonella TaxID=28610 RepID=UPI0017843623|nr:uncharacterized protein LOC118751079 [Rhagoletis pomonella]
MENKKKRNIWREKEIIEMISIIKEKHILKLLDSKIKRNRSIFEEVARALNSKGIKTDAIQIRAKFKSLKSDYYKAKRNNNSSGAERQTCDYFEMLDEVLGHRPAVSVEGVDTSQTERPADNTNTSQSSYLEVEADCIEENDHADGSESSPACSTPRNPKTFKNQKKNSYLKAMESFTNEWKKTQENLVDSLKKQDETHFSKVELLLERNRKETQKMLEDDRHETAKMFSSLLSTMQMSQPSNIPVYMPHHFLSPSLALAPEIVSATPGEFDIFRSQQSPE